MGLVRDLVDQWSFADHLGLEPPLWLGLLAVAPGVAGIALLPPPESRYIAAALVLAVPAFLILVVASAPFSPFKDNTRQLVPLAVSAGMLAIAGRWSPAIAYIGAPLAIALIPALTRVYGVGLNGLETMIWVRRKGARIRAWFANPDDTALHLEPIRTEADDVVFRVVATDREIVIAAGNVGGAHGEMMKHRYIAFDPKLALDDKPSGAYRGSIRERLLGAVALPIRGDNHGALSLWFGEIVAGLAMVIVVQAILLAASYGAVRVTALVG